MNSRSQTPALLRQIASDWQRTDPALDSGPMLTLLLLSRLHSTLAREIEQTYLPHGLNAAGWDLLLTLYRSAPPEGLTPTELSRLAAISGPSMSNRTERLLRRGLIERWPGEQDRRSVRVGLSSAGRQLVATLLPQHTRTARRLLSGLSTADQALLRTLAAQLVTQIEHDLLQGGQGGERGQGRQG